MSIRVNTGVEGHTYDQDGATFSVDGNGNLTLSVADGTLAVYAPGRWSHVVDEQFSPLNQVAPPVAGAAPVTPTNAAPPHRTEVVTEEPITPANEAPPAPTEPPAPVEPVTPTNASPPLPDAPPADEPVSANPAPPA